MITAVTTAVFAIGYLTATIWLCRGIKLSARDLALGGMVCFSCLGYAGVFGGTPFWGWPLPYFCGAAGMSSAAWSSIHKTLGTVGAHGVTASPIICPPGFWKEY